MRAPLLCLLFSAEALAAEANGYLDLRAQYTRSRPGGLIPADDLPHQSALLELNLQARHPLAERSLVSGDLSLIGQLAGDFRGLDAQGANVALPPRDVLATHPLVSLNELYLSLEALPELTFLLGKKRLVWGSGLAFNPTDLLNPPKDPTDPTFQRSGSYLARVEVPLEKFAFTFLAAPMVTEQDNGLPFRLLTYPDWDQRDTQYHYLLAARAYALWADADLNLMLFFGNRFPDAFERKARLGASFSRVFFTDYEAHFELLLQSGSARDGVSSECVENAAAVLRCLSQGTPLVSKPGLSDPTLLPRVLLGGRKMFADDSLFSLEYLYQADGYDRAQFQALVDGLDLLREARQLGAPLPALPLPGAASAEGVPQKLAFEPLSRHYLFLTYQKPRLREDFTLSATLIANLQDLSGLVSPSLSWSAREWLTLTAAFFAPFTAPTELDAQVKRTGERVSEYSLAPMRYRALLQARAHY